VRSASYESVEKEVALLIEDFLARLARVLSKHKGREHEVEEMEERMKGVVLIERAVSAMVSGDNLPSLHEGLKLNEPRDLLQGISSRMLTDKLDARESRHDRVALGVATTRSV
jgi:hypothetical protein